MRLNEDLLGHSTVLVLLFVNLPVQDLLRCLVELPVAHREASQAVMPCFYFQSWCAAVAAVGPLTPEQADGARQRNAALYSFLLPCKGACAMGVCVCFLGGGEGVPRELLTVFLDSQECLPKVWGNGWHHACAHSAARVHSLGEVGG